VTFIHGAIAGKLAPQNPWNSESLEFSQTAIIPGQGNFPDPIIIPEGWSPYGYGKNPAITYDLDARKHAEAH